MVQHSVVYRIVLMLPLMRVATACGEEHDKATERADASLGSAVDATADASSGTAASDAAVEPAGACTGRLSSPTTGKACGCSNDCDVGERCARETETGLARGLCIRTCQDDDGCADGYFCGETIEGDPSSSGCLASCAQSNDCPEGRLCRVNDPIGRMWCTPRCFGDSDCPATGHCDLYSGDCQAEDEQLAENGARCNANEECRGGLCFRGASGTHVCVSPCSTQRGGCPAGSACRTPLVGELSSCFRLCESDEECLDDYVCRLRGQFKFCVEP